MEQILDKTCNNSKFRAIFVIDCLAGKDKEDKGRRNQEIWQEYLKSFQV